MTERLKPGRDRRAGISFGLDSKRGGAPIHQSDSPSALRRIAFPAALFGLILCAILRSGIATKLDGFTIDEPYHITAGVSYIRTGDYRLNPEHPPLVKLWVGAALSRSLFHLPDFRPLQDKADEREFAERAVFQASDPDRVRSRVRVAMFSLNGLLLFFFALAARRVFGDVMALAAVALLAVDPTISAHLPLVMTDLPVALLSATAMLWGTAAFRTWRGLDLMLVALFLGLTLASKHSGLVTVLAIAVFGSSQAIFSAGALPARATRASLVACVLMAALIVLWAFYSFRFNESRQGGDLFNRPIAEKIGDLNSNLFKTSLRLISETHLMPRAYIWGLADTLRAGIEGRNVSVYAFGKRYYKKAPVYFFPGVLIFKLPLGIIILVIIGLFLFVKRGVPGDWHSPQVGVILLAVSFFVALGSGSPYAGVRHAIPIIPLLCLLGAAAIYQAIKTRSNCLRLITALAGVWALVSAGPAIRPWEYYNELLGGPSKSWHYFNDEGVDLGQRSSELVKYYDEHLRPTSEIPYIYYYISKPEMERRGLDWIGEKAEDYEVLERSDVVSGTFFVSAAALAPGQWWDMAALRKATPAARFGNLFVFRGTFDSSWLKAGYFYLRALEYLKSPAPDEQKAEEFLSKSLEIDSKAFFVAIELGNLRAKRGSREGAIRAFEMARANAPSDEIIVMLTTHIERISNEPPELVPTLRNPSLE